MLDCYTDAPHFSNPDVTYNGVPTGDTHTRNNARVLNETAYAVSNFRLPPVVVTYELPLFPGADDASGIEGFARNRNVSLIDGEIEVYAIDDTGQRFGPATLTINAGQTKHFNSGALERGSVSKGLMGGVGNGAGLWRLELKTTLTLLPRAYIRTLDRFVTSMHQLAPTLTDEKRIHIVSFFNAGNNTAVRSLLCVINPNPFSAYVTCRGWDDEGIPGESAVEFTIAPQSAVLLPAQELETGGPGFTGRLAMETASGISASLPTPPYRS